jgi:hypothetical protein
MHNIVNWSRTYIELGVRKAGNPTLRSGFYKYLIIITAMISKIPVKQERRKNWKSWSMAEGRYLHWENKRNLWRRLTSGSRREGGRVSLMSARGWGKACSWLFMAKECSWRKLLDFRMGSVGADRVGARGVAWLREVGGARTPCPRVATPTEWFRMRLRCGALVLCERIYGKTPGRM